VLRSTGRLGMFGISMATTSSLFGPLRLLPVGLGMAFFHPLALMKTNKLAFGVNLGQIVSVSPSPPIQRTTNIMSFGTHQTLVAVTLSTT
jgi:hypothetical protein